MQLVILAGGLATRLGPLSKRIPKSMIKVNGKPFLEYQIEIAKKNGIHRLVLCVGYLREKIQSYLENGKKFGVEIVYSEERKLLGTGGALKHAESLLDDQFFLMYGDSYLRTSFKRVANFFGKFEALGLLTVQKHPNPVHKNNLLVKDNLVVDYGKNKTGMTRVEYGLSIYRKDALRNLPKNKVIDLSVLQKRLARRKELLAYNVKIPFMEIGSVQGLAEFRDYIKDIRRRSLLSEDTFKNG